MIDRFTDSHPWLALVGWHLIWLVPVALYLAIR